MAKIKDIQAQIVAQKDTHTELAPLNATGDGIVWWAWTWVVATVIWIQTDLWLVLKSDILRLGSTIQYATAQWYVSMSFNFQYGYSLIWNDTTKRYVYANDIPAAKIVKYAAFTESLTGNCLLKVAKEVSNLPAPLTSAELLAFQSYIYTIKQPGTFILCISENADLCKIYMDVYYNPITPLIDLQPKVENAINDYITKLPFNAKFQILRLVDKVQAIESVEDISNVNVSAKFGSNPYTPVQREYTAYSGYMNIDTAYPLSVTINYIPTI